MSARGSGAVSTGTPTAGPPERLRWDALQIVLVVLVSMQVWRVQDLFPILPIKGVPVLSTAIAVGLLLLDRDPRRRLVALNQPLVRAVVGIVALVGLSIPGSLYPRLSVEFLLVDYLRSVILMLLVAASIRGLPDLRRLAWLQMLGVTLFSAVIMATSRIGSDGRLVAVNYYDANDLAMLIVCTLPLALYLWRRPSGLLARALVAAATVLLVMTLGKTGSRGGFLAFVTVSGYLLLRFRGASRAMRWGAVAVLAVLLVSLASDKYFERIQTILHPSSDYNWSGKSETGRLEIWKRGIGYMMDRPAFGVGAGAFGVAEGTLAPQARARRRYGKDFEWTTAHNSFVQIGAELGVGGLILFVVVLGGGFRLLWRVRRGSAAEPALLAQVLTASLAGFLTSALFLSQAYAAYLYALLGMCLGLRKIAAPVGARGSFRGTVPGPSAPAGNGATQGVRLPSGLGRPGR